MHWLSSARSISLSSKIQMMRTLVTSIFLYACEWAPQKNTSHGNAVLPQDTTHLIQRPCYQRGSPCQDAAGIGPYEDPLTIVKRRKLQWYGHVSRPSGLAKTILPSTVKGVGKQGRQKKRWEDTREWTGLVFAKSQRAAESREKWRKLVVKSSVVSQRPSRLREWWWWWWW